MNRYVIDLQKAKWNWWFMAREWGTCRRDYVMEAGHYMYSYCIDTGNTCHRITPEVET